MLALSLLFVPVLLGPLLAELSPEARRGMSITGWSIWGLFVLEYLWLLYLAPDRSDMVKTHKLDLVVVCLPFLRPLRFLRFVRLASAASGVGRAAVAFRRIGGRPGFQPFYLTVFVTILTGAGFALAFEHEQRGASMQDYGDALWWAIVTCTTVGYGDHFPVTAGGQVVAVTLMVVGIAGISLLTASIAALFVDTDEQTDIDSIKEQLDRIEHLLAGKLAESGRPRS